MMIMYTEETDYIIGGVILLESWVEEPSKLGSLEVSWKSESFTSPTTISTHSSPTSVKVFYRKVTPEEVLRGSWDLCTEG